MLSTIKPASFVISFQRSIRSHIRVDFINEKFLIYLSLRFILFHESMKKNFWFLNLPVGLIQRILFWIYKPHVLLRLLIDDLFKLLELVRGIFHYLLHFIDFVHLVVTLRLVSCFWEIFEILKWKFRFFYLCLIADRLLIAFTVNFFQQVYLKHVQLRWHLLFFRWYVFKWVLWFFIYSSFLWTIIQIFFFILFHLFIFFNDVLFKFQSFFRSAVVVIFFALYKVFNLLLVHILGFLRFFVLMMIWRFLNNLIIVDCVFINIFKW